HLHSSGISPGAPGLGASPLFQRAVSSTADYHWGWSFGKALCSLATPPLVTCVLFSESISRFVKLTSCSKPWSLTCVLFRKRTRRFVSFLRDCIPASVTCVLLNDRLARLVSPCRCT